MPAPRAVRLRGTTLRRPPLSGRTMMICAMALFLVVVLASPLQSYLGRRGAVAASERQQRQLAAKLVELRRERVQWQDPAFVERQARVRLQYIRPGDTLYTVLNPDGSPRSSPGDDATRTVAPAVRPAGWNTQLWASVRAADSAG